MTDHTTSSQYVATIEPVSTCPVKCEMCPVSRADLVQPRAQLMSMETAGTVAARLKHEFGVESIFWGNWGEPLVHPQITELARVFARVGLNNQFLSSSLSAHFDAETFVRSDIGHLDISLSGITAEIYNVGHKHGNWDLIRSNMEALSEARRRLPGSIGVDIRWHRYRYNEFQLDAARSLATKLGFGFKPYFAHLGGIDALRDYERGTLPESKQEFVRQNVFLEFTDQVIAQHRGGTSCPMDRNLIIHSDGSLLHCCALMSSHRDGVDFLTIDRERVVQFKSGGNPHCGECLSKGWAGYTHASKTEADLSSPKPRTAFPQVALPLGFKQNQI